MGKKSRADRRHHHQRMIDRVKNFHWFRRASFTEEEIDYKAKRMAENRQPCSCHMCGNPRTNWNEMTLQEQKAYIKEKFDSECG